MKLNIRKLTEKDWSILKSWWDQWPDWPTPAKDFLPENGKGGLIVEKGEKPVMAGFLYFTNSKTALLEWVISDPNYRDNDREQALELLIIGSENLCKSLNYKYMFSITQNKNLIAMHEKLGWHKDKTPSYELTKKIY